VNPNDLDEETVPDRVRNLTDGGADVSVDALGIAETCRNSVRSVRPRGTHVQVGLTTEAERGEGVAADRLDDSLGGVVRRLARDAPDQLRRPVRARRGDRRGPPRW